MITSINEFFFSNHYLYDNDNRFNLRIKNAKILNNLPNNKLADKRLKQALFYYGLEVLDKTSIALQPVAIVFGNIYFKSNNRLIPTEIQIDNNIKGNVYVAIINNQTVITLKLLPLSISNDEIVNDIKRHDNTDLLGLYDMDHKQLNLHDKKRKTIVIDLDISDSEFINLYPAPLLKNNPYQKDGNGISDMDMLWINKNKNIEKPIISYNTINANIKEIIPTKEFVISEGMKIWVSYIDGPKEKVIKKIIRNTIGDKVKYYLEFENTLKQLELKIGDSFIISPSMKTDNFTRIYNAFNLEVGTPLHFKGPIDRLSYYSKEKTKTVHKLGIIIDPRVFF